MSVTNKTKVDLMQKYTLYGDWKLYYYPYGRYDVKFPNQLDLIPINPIAASVPGNVELDLIQAGILPENIFFANNIYDLKKYETYEWWYICEFVPSYIDPLMSNDVSLCFNGVDCLADYWLNDVKIGYSENMFVEHIFSVGKKLNIFTSNTLAVHIFPPMVDAKKKVTDPIHSINFGEVNSEYIWHRKAAHSYGWDIMPRAVSAGIWRSIEVLISGEHEISQLYVFTRSICTNIAKVGIFYSIKTALDLLTSLKIRIRGKCETSTFDEIFKIVALSGIVYFDINEPKLWWPKNYGEANLYDLEFQLLFENNVIAKKHLRFGIRIVDLIHTDTTSMESPGQFMFRINDVPIMCKGSNWVPCDVFHSQDNKRVVKTLELFNESNCNIVRCWAVMFTKIINSLITVMIMELWFGRILQWHVLLIHKQRIFKTQFA